MISSRSGGVPAISGNLAEDTAISVGLARLGLKTVFAHRDDRTGDRLPYL